MSRAFPPPAAPPGKQRSTKAHTTTAPRRNSAVTGVEFPASKVIFMEGADDALTVRREHDVRIERWKRSETFRLAGRLRRRSSMRCGRSWESL